MLFLGPTPEAASALAGGGGATSSQQQLTQQELTRRLRRAARSLLGSAELAAARERPTGCWLAQKVAECRDARAAAAAADGPPPLQPRDTALEALLLLRFAELPRLSHERLLWAALDDARRQELDADEKEELEAALCEAGAAAVDQLAA